MWDAAAMIERARLFALVLAVAVACGPPQPPPAECQPNETAACSSADAKTKLSALRALVGKDVVIAGQLPEPGEKSPQPTTLSVREAAEKK